MTRKSKLCNLLRNLQGSAENSLADQGTSMEFDHTKLIFQCCFPLRFTHFFYRCWSVWIPLVKNHYQRIRYHHMNLLDNELFSQWTFQPPLVFQQKYCLRDMGLSKNHKLAPLKNRKWFYEIPGSIYFELMREGGRKEGRNSRKEGKSQRNT